MASVMQRSGKWYVKYKDYTGEQIRVGTQARNKTEARRLALELESLAEKQRMGLAPIPLPTDSETVAELMSWWLKTFSVGKPDHERERGTVLKHFVHDPIGAIRMRALTIGDVEAYLRRKVTEGLSENTANHLRAYLRRAFNESRRTERWKGGNPAADARPLKFIPFEGTALDADAVPVVLSAIPDDLRPLFATAVMTGLRKGELFGLQKRDVDLEGRTIRVCRSHNRDRTKGGKASVLPIVPTLVPYLVTAMDTALGDLVFPDADGDMRRDDSKLGRILRTALKKVGIIEGYAYKCRRQGCGYTEQDKVASERRCPRCQFKLWETQIPKAMRFHDLRHTTATIMIKAGAPIAAVQKVMRHSTPTLTVGTYGHLDQRDLRSAMSSLDLVGAWGAEASEPEAVELASTGTVGPRGPYGVQAPRKAGPVSGRAPENEHIFSENWRAQRDSKIGTAKSITCDPRCDFGRSLASGVRVRDFRTMPRCTIPYRPFALSHSTGTALR